MRKKSGSKTCRAERTRRRRDDERVAFNLQSKGRRGESLTHTRGVRGREIDTERGGGE